MSCYEWERGSVVIPRKSWPGLKKAIREAFNRMQQARYEYALKAHGLLIEAGRGKRGFNYAAEFDYGETARRFPRAPDREAKFLAGAALFFVNGTRVRRPVKPKKSAFAPATVRTDTFPLGEASIRLDEAAHTFHWNVPENNHAVEQAHENPVALVAFRELGRVEFTRGSGGQLWANNEYNRDDGREYAGGGGSFVTHDYHPLSAAEKRERGRRAAFVGGWGSRF